MPRHPIIEQLMADAVAYDKAAQQAISHISEAVKIITESNTNNNTKLPLDYQVWEATDIHGRKCRCLVFNGNTYYTIEPVYLGGRVVKTSTEDIMHFVSDLAFGRFDNFLKR